MHSLLVINYSSKMLYADKLLTKTDVSKLRYRNEYSLNQNVKLRDSDCIECVVLLTGAIAIDNILPDGTGCQSV